LKKDYPISIFSGTNIPGTTGHQMTVQEPTSPKGCFYTTCENQKSEICVEMNKKRQKPTLSIVTWRRIPRFS